MSDARKPSLGIFLFGIWFIVTGLWGSGLGAYTLLQPQEATQKAESYVKKYMDWRMKSSHTQLSSDKTFRTDMDGFMKEALEASSPLQKRAYGFFDLLLSLTALVGGIGLVRLKEWGRSLVILQVAAIAIYQLILKFILYPETLNILHANLGGSEKNKMVLELVQKMMPFQIALSVLSSGVLFLFVCWFFNRAKVKAKFQGSSSQDIVANVYGEAGTPQQKDKLSKRLGFWLIVGCIVLAGSYVAFYAKTIWFSFNYFQTHPEMMGHELPLPPADGTQFLVKLKNVSGMPTSEIKSKTRQLESVLRWHRLDELGLDEKMRSQAQITMPKYDTICVQLPGFSNVSKGMAVLSRKPSFELRVSNNGASDVGTALASGELILSSEDIKKVAPYQRESGKAIIVFTTPAGKDRLKGATENNVGKKLVIIIDGKINATPIITGAITGGSFLLSYPQTDAKEMADWLDFFKSVVFAEPFEVTVSKKESVAT